jgi:hypothetical protein
VYRIANLRGQVIDKKSIMLIQCTTLIAVVGPGYYLLGMPPSQEAAACPKGTYNHVEGAVGNCNSCPTGLSTTLNAATTEELCGELHQATM